MNTRICSLVGVLLLAPVAVGAGADDWIASPQPDLSEQIKNALPLQVENVSQPTRTVRHEAPQFVPNVSGTPDILVVYYKGYQGPATLFATDTNTDEVTRSEIPRGRNTHIVGNSIAGNGKLYSTLQLVGGGLELWVYDPVENRFSKKEAFGKEIGLFGQANKVISAADGYLYGTVGSRMTGQAAFYRINPDDDSVTILGTGGGLKGSPYAGALMLSDDGKLYATYGKTPYRLIEFDPKSGKGRELATANPRDNIHIYGQPDGSVAFSITMPESRVDTAGEYVLDPGSGDLRRLGDANIKRDKLGAARSVSDDRKTADGKEDGLKRQYQQLIKNGLSPKEAKAKVLSSGRVRETRPQRDADNRKADLARKGKSAFAAQQGLLGGRSGGVVIDVSRLDPTVNPDRRGRLRYRRPGENTWCAVQFDPPLYAEAIIQLKTLPDGRIFGTATNRAGHFIHDPATDDTTFLGRTGLQHHSSAVSGHRIYLSGYPSSLVWSYDFTGPPWVEPRRNKKLGSGAFGSTPAADNPRMLGALREFSGVHMATCAATDSAGRVYFAGRWYRDGKGGGIGWWDPQQEKAGGFWESLSTLHVSDCCATGDGRYIVLSTLLVPDAVLGRDAPESAQLCVVDTTKESIVIARRITPLPESVTTGLIAPAGGDRVIGIAPFGDESEKWLLYGVDVETGDIAFTKDFPGIPDTKVRAAEMLHSYRNALETAPDGSIWMKHLGALLRIDPRTADIEVVGRPILAADATAGFDTLSAEDRNDLTRLGMLKADGAPATVGRMTFSGNDLYLAGTSTLRRTCGVLDASTK